MMWGDWIKIDHRLPDKPEVALLANGLSISHDEAVGKLIRFWTWLDQNGHPMDATDALIDRVTLCPGFCETLIAVGWLTRRKKGGFSIPDFERHNGKAKSRARTALRVEAHRKGEEPETPEPLADPETIGNPRSLVEDTPVNRWLHSFNRHRPTAGHPLGRITDDEAMDLRVSIGDAIEQHGESQALELLAEVFEMRPRPTSVKQALYSCSKVSRKDKPSAPPESPDRCSCHKCDCQNVPVIRHGVYGGEDRWLCLQCENGDC